MLSESAKTVAAQIALKVFIFSPNSDLRVVKLRLFTQMEIDFKVSDEAHNIRPLIFMQGFLHVNKRNYLT